MTNILMMKITSFLKHANWNKTSLPFSITLWFYLFFIQTFADITTITVTSPAQNVVWTYGQSYNIEWNITGSGM